MEVNIKIQTVYYTFTEESLMITFMKNFIANVREAKGLSQDQLAELIGVKQNYISRYESGAINPPLPVLVRIAQALQSSLDMLILGKNLDTMASANSAYLDALVYAIKPSCSEKDRTDLADMIISSGLTSAKEIKAFIDGVSKASERGK